MGRGNDNRGESHRIQRVEREIREVIGSYLITGFKGELPGIVSVSRVIVSRDLRNAKVLITVMGYGANDGDPKALKKIQDEALSELKAHAPAVQSEVNRRLRMKYCPKLTFLYDEGFDNVMKVEKILRDLGEQRVRIEEASMDSEDSSDESDEN